MGMDALVSKYFDQIEIERADYLPIDNAKSDVASLDLIIPTEMLREYLALKGYKGKEKLPDAALFWKETGLVKKLRGLKNEVDGNVGYLSDALDYLEGKVCGDFEELTNPPHKIRFIVTEMPEFYPAKAEIIK